MTLQKVKARKILAFDKKSEKFFNALITKMVTRFN